MPCPMGAICRPVIYSSLTLFFSIERYLGKHGVGAARHLEIDTTDRLVAMVAEGIGWTLITLLCLPQSRAEPDAVAVG